MNSKSILIATGAIIFCFLHYGAYAGEQAVSSKAVILLTSNLEGRFIPGIEGQERNDPMVLLAQSIIMERRGRDLIYLDLGNAFHPGIVSRYSYGSVMMDFFSSFGCDAILVSSKDLQAGIGNLEFLQKPRAAPLLSSNIYREKEYVFAPYVVRKINGVQVGFVGLSAESILFNVAEKNIYQVRLEDAVISLKAALSRLDESGVRHIIVLSGLPFETNTSLLEQFPQIGLLVSGSDNSGRVSRTRVMRVDMPDGRAIVSAPVSSGYYLMEVELRDGISLMGIVQKNPAYHETGNEDYRRFISRLTRWKDHLSRELGKPLAKNRTEPLDLNQNSVGALLRHVYDTELAVLGDDALTSTVLKGEAGRMDVLSAVHDDYTIYIFELSGADLKKTIASGKNYYFDGYEKGKIQGYDIADGRHYRIAATQPVAESIEKMVGHEIVFQNTWKSMADAVVEDIAGDSPVLSGKDFRYLDNRFRNTLDILFSFFYENNTVERGATIGTPPGKTEKSYMKWGLESRMDLTLYNRYHMIMVTPYIYYVRQDDLYLNNLLRGTLFYRVNFDFWLKPYHKSQIDSVLFAVNDLRPTILRETAGADMEYSLFRGRFGFGFEKQILDPVESVVYGLEGLVTAEYTFQRYFSCSLGWDSFIALGEMPRDQRYFRSELFSNLTVKLYKLLGFSFKYRWFYYYSFYRKEQYSSSQFTTSADLRTDFKIW